MLGTQNIAACLLEARQTLVTGRCPGGILGNRDRWAKEKPLCEGTGNFKVAVNPGVPISQERLVWMWFCSVVLFYPGCVGYLKLTIAKFLESPTQG